MNEVGSQVDNFIRRNASRRIALVTSGGTRVPLEKNTVRFIDNFSMGTRGSASAECFLAKGYAVIFFYREQSLMPFSRKYSSLFDHLEVDNAGHVYVKGMPGLAEAVNAFNESRDRLLFIPFTDVTYYLATLEEICIRLHPLGSAVLVYLAAAVSDFYITHDKLPTHKIHSSDGDLQLTLSIVPKFLKKLVNELLPDAFIISFKLETDESVLVDVARKALQRYGHKLVIGNLLHTRKERVVFVENDKAEEIRLNDEQKANNVEIEQLIIDRLVQIHDHFQANK
uniref:DNA/pantothenate metabolism flavoprotein C-terminal domain-containing protein n=1 Tax=Parascaris univalens TaxID=6257 RepID=A0A915AGX2_PARUN